MLSKGIYPLILLTGALTGLPLLGAVLAGNPIRQYLQFPPLTHSVQHLAFSKPAFWFFSLVAIALFTTLACLLRGAKKTPASPRAATGWPWWGWLAGLALALMWYLAWTRHPWFAPLQAYTFTPLWLSFIVLVNARTYANRGACLLTDQPRLLCWLFPLSSVFWWYFEYLNRYVQNWYYLEVESFSATGYVIHASLAFATVLPAVASVTEYLASLNYFGNEAYQPVVRISRSRGWALVTLVVGALGLIGIAIWPGYLFPLVWITPLLLFVALQILNQEPDVITGTVRTGQWRQLALPAFAALLCGFFWELWNYYSYAKWQYSIPLVHSFKVFEMPILGYAGYPVFGIECVVVTQWLRRRIKPGP